MSSKIFSLTSGLMLAAASLFAPACGDLGTVDINLTFPDVATQAATRKLMLIVREAPKMGNGCDALWTMQSNGLRQSPSIINYPNRNDTVVAPVDLAQYPKLSLLVYAYPSAGITTDPPIAGGCQNVTTNASSTMTVTIKLDKPPPTK